MALLSQRPFCDSKLPLDDGTEAKVTYIFEPEFHQDIYRLAGEKARESTLGSFQLGDSEIVARAINRGKQPEYVDDQDDPDSLAFIGYLSPSGRRLTREETSNVAALKSVAIRSGYVDIDAARAVSDSYFKKNEARSSVVRGDVLINSTGDGTIGRVAVYHYDFPAVVDGHVTIVRFKDVDLAWYAAAYLLTENGQHQLYRYINGSSGQVEIYPQDIARLWIPKRSDGDMKSIGKSLREGCEQFEAFRTQMGKTLALAAQ